MLVDVVDEPVLVLAHTKKIVGLSYDRGFRPVIWALSVNQFSLRIKTLTTKAIEAFIITEVNISILFDPAQDQPDGLLVVLIRRANEIVVGNI